MTHSERSLTRPSALLTRLSVPCVLLSWSLVACNVESQDTTTTGIALPNEPEGGSAALDGAPRAEAPRGFVVVGTDYQSTSISLVDVDGVVQSASFIGSASASTGLSAPLSGDVVVPSATLAGDEIVLVDRRPAAVLTWVDLRSASVRAQLNVGTGFSANPQDYVPVSPDKAYVPRFEDNPGAGREPFDAGSDLLVIDPAQPAVLGRIDLRPALGDADARFLPGATRALLAGGFVRVLSAPFTADFAEFLPSRLVSIDPDSDSVSHVLELEDLTNCANLGLSPDGSVLAISCSGVFGQDPALGYPDAGIALVELGEPPRVIERFSTAELGGEQVGALAYATETSLVFTTYGRYTSDGAALEVPDTCRRLDLQSRALDPEAVARTESTAFSLGDIRCAPSAGTCLLADAETRGGVLKIFSVAGDGRLALRDALAPNPALGLPPRYLGTY